MISLQPVPSRQPLQPGADLVAHLAASPRPAVIQYSADGRTELSGRVAINWATKTTHLLDSYGVAAPDTILVDVPVTWRSTVLTLGVAWCGLPWAESADDADAVLTDRPGDQLAAAGEIFVTQADIVDTSMVDVDDEVLSHADQALVPVPDIIGNAQTATPTREQISTHTNGVVIQSEGLRFNASVWWAMVDAWRRSTPVVIVDATETGQLARIIATERLGEPVAR